jgi:hypothetical protein
LGCLCPVRGSGGSEIRIERQLRPVDLQAHTEVCGLLSIHRLVGEARANYEGHRVCQCLVEAILASMRQENVDACLQYVDLRHDGDTDGVGWHAKIPERVLLGTE